MLWCLLPLACNCFLPMVHDLITIPLQGPAKGYPLFDATLCMVLLTPVTNLQPPSDPTTFCLNANPKVSLNIAGKQAVQAEFSLLSALLTKGSSII